MKCPICHGNTIGKIGNNQYYCWDCYVEFSSTGNQIEVFDIGEDGSLVAVNNDNEVVSYTDASLT